MTWENKPTRKNTRDPPHEGRDWSPLCRGMIWTKSCRVVLRDWKFLMENSVESAKNMSIKIEVVAQNASSHQDVEEIVFIKRLNISKENQSARKWLQGHKSSAKTSFFWWPYEPCLHGGFVHSLTTESFPAALCTNGDVFQGPAPWVFFPPFQSVSQWPWQRDVPQRSAPAKGTLPQVSHRLAHGDACQRCAS